MKQLDKDAQHFLHVFNERAQKELDNKKLSQLPIKEARKKIGKLLAPADDDQKIELPEFDVTVGDSSFKFEINNQTVTMPIKIYAPNGDEQLPVIMYFHGGGFALGDAGLIDFGCQYLASQLHCRVISVDYRKSPEYKFPTAHQDAYLSTLYVAEHPEEFKSNGVIAVAGDSAGGNLATSVCHQAKASNAFKIAFQFLIYPWVDLNNNSPSDSALARGYYLELDTLNWMTSLYTVSADDKNNPLASPLLRSHFENLPPAYIVIGDADPIYDDAKAYAEKLKSAGNTVVFQEMPGILHDYCALPTFYGAVQTTFSAAVKVMKEHVK